MERTTNYWLMKIIFPEDDYIVTIYNNGTVYGKEHNQKIGILKRSKMKTIRGFINDSLFMLKNNDGYFKQQTKGTIIKINDISRRNRSLSILGWDREKLIIDILKDSSCYYKYFNV